VILYLHGRGDEPTDPPGDLVLKTEWPTELKVPILDELWQGQRFYRRIAEVDAWMDHAELAIGHSFGGWLLLYASSVRLETGRHIPRLLLLGSVVGTGAATTGEKIKTYSAPPGMPKVHAALGLHGGKARSTFPPNRLEFIHGVGDRQSPVGLVKTLANSFLVQIVPGGHRLEHPKARKVLISSLGRFREKLKTGKV
jgi:hypothetical protein